MATSTISNTVKDATGAAIAGAKVRIRLMPCAGFRVTELTEVAQRYDIVTDANGAWSVALEQNTNITPSGTYYEAEEALPITSGGPKKWTFLVGATNQTLSAALISAVPAITTSTYLTQAAADARYVQSPGSFAVVGSITDSRPSDALAAGVLTTYARGDHKHSRETIYGTAAARAALSGVDLVNGQRFVESDTFKWYDRIASAWKQVGKWFIDTAANKPATVYAGQSIYVTDATNITGAGIYTPDATSQPARAGNQWYHNGTNWQYGEWGKPWGIVGVATNTSGAFTFTTIADATGLTVTFTAAANRRYKITVFCPRISNPTTASISAVVYVTDGSNNILDQAQVPEGPTHATGGGSHCNLTVVHTPAAGSFTYKVRMARDSGTDTHTLVSSATNPAMILVEDIGPNGAPT